MKIEVEKISPKQAEAILAEANFDNRKVRKNIVTRYANDMVMGRWKQTGDPIRFAGSGELIDGQHRLLAVVEARKPQKFLVIRGLKPDAKVAIDTGAPRSFSDILAFEGHTHTTLLAACVRWMWLYEENAVERRSTSTVSNGDLLAWLHEHPEMVEHVKWGGNLGSHVWRRFRGGMQTVVVCIRYITARSVPGELDAFWAQVVTGERLEQGMPAYALRQWVEREQLTHNPAPVITRQAVTVKAWNAFIEGEEIGNLRWRRGGAEPEAFPRVQFTRPGDHF